MNEEKCIYCGHEGNLKESWPIGGEGIGGEESKKILVCKYCYCIPINKQGDDIKSRFELAVAFSAMFNELEKSFKQQFNESNK